MCIETNVLDVCHNHIQTNISLTSFVVVNTACNVARSQTQWECALLLLSCIAFINSSLFALSFQLFFPNSNKQRSQPIINGLNQQQQQQIFLSHQIRSATWITQCHSAKLKTKASRILFSLRSTYSTSSKIWTKNQINLH